MSFGQVTTAVPQAPLSAREQQPCEQRGMGLVRGALGAALADTAGAGSGGLSGLELIKQAMGSQLEAAQGQQQQQQQQAPAAAPASAATGQLEPFDGPLHFFNDRPPAAAQQQQQQQQQEGTAAQRSPYHIPAPNLAAAWGVPLVQPWHMPPPASRSPSPPPACHSPTLSISVSTQTHAQQRQQQLLQTEPSLASAASTQQQEGFRELHGAFRTWRMHARIHKHYRWGWAAAACLPARQLACPPARLPACLPAVAHLPARAAQRRRNAATPRCRAEQAQAQGQAAKACKVQRLRELQRAFDHWHGVQQRRRAVLTRAVGHWASHSKELCFGGWRLAARTSSQQRQLSSSHCGRASKRRVLLAWANASAACRTKVRSCHAWAACGAGAASSLAQIVLKAPVVLPGRKGHRPPCTRWRMQAGKVMAALSHWMGHTKAGCFRSWHMFAAGQQAKLRGLAARRALLPLRAWQKLARDGAQLRHLQVGAARSWPAGAGLPAVRPPALTLQPGREGSRSLCPQGHLAQRHVQRVQRQAWGTWRSRFQTRSQHYRLLHGAYVARRRHTLQRVLQVRSSLPSPHLQRKACVRLQPLPSACSCSLHRASERRPSF